MSSSCGSRSSSRTESASAGSSMNTSSTAIGASFRLRRVASSPLCAGLGTTTEPPCRASISCAPPRPVSVTSPCRTYARRRKSVADFRMAQGREGAAGHRCHRGARHRSGRCCPRALAACPQSPVGRRAAATLYTDSASSLAASTEAHLMTNRPIALVTIVAAAAVIETVLGPKPAPRFVWNVSESVPTGLYQVQPARDLIVTTLVVAYPPEPLATLLGDGGYLPRDVPLIKRILALPGQTVCRTGPTIAVHGIEMGVAREYDHRGRMLPVWQGCRVVAGDQ